tara:strand:- start:197 stop:736 length:540 start_codon:yes stop_codon:yes gene_type:complete
MNKYKNTDYKSNVKNPESLLWQKVKKGLTDCFLTRIESSTINGIPDVHAVAKTKIFWIELKSDHISFPALNKWQIVWINKYIKAGGSVFILHENLGKALFERVLKLYEPVSLFTDPRLLKPRASFSFPYDWPAVQSYLLQVPGAASDEARSRLVEQSRSRLRKELPSQSRQRTAQAPST